METPKITKVELELDAVSGELRVMHDLLNIFANWFEETHKADVRRLRLVWIFASGIIKRTEK